MTITRQESALVASRKLQPLVSFAQISQEVFWIDKKQLELQQTPQAPSQSQGFAAIQNSLQDQKPVDTATPASPQKVCQPDEKKFYCKLKLIFCSHGVVFLVEMSANPVLEQQEKAILARLQKNLGLNQESQVAINWPVPSAPEAQTLAQAQEFFQELMKQQEFSTLISLCSEPSLLKSQDSSEFFFPATKLILGNKMSLYREQPETRKELWKSIQNSPLSQFIPQ